MEVIVLAKSKKNVVEYRIYDLPVELPIILLAGEKWRISDQMSNRLHFHNCIEIGFCHSGSGSLVFECETTSFRVGDITIIPRHVPHTTCSQKGEKSLWSYLFVDLIGLISGLLPVDAALEMSQSDWLGQSLLLNNVQFPRIHFLCNCLLEELTAKSNDWLRMAQSQALLLYYELRRLNQEQQKPEAKQSKKSFALKPVLEYIHTHYSKQTTMKELSDICHLSETHFRRLFLSTMGTSPLNFINATRINQACILLDTTDMPILEIAEAVGISSVSSFNRNFHQIMSISPRDYRNAKSKASITPKQKYILTYKGWFAAEDCPEDIALEPNTPNKKSDS